MRCQDKDKSKYKEKDKAKLTDADRLLLKQAKKLLKKRKKELDGGDGSDDDSPGDEPMLPSHEEVCFVRSHASALAATAD